MLITTRWATERLGRDCPSRHDLERRFDEKLIHFGGSNHVLPATPNNPLRVLLGNTLSMLINFAVIGRARRVFLFGADGRISDDFERETHYGSKSADYRFDISEAHRETIRGALAADTTCFSHITEIGLIAAEQLFGLDRPPIYNVCPDSAIDLFPRISYDEALEMLAGTGARRGIPMAGVT